MKPCPCGSGKALSECCGPIIHGMENAPTAEALMRSRFSAFALGHIEHIQRTYALAIREACPVPNSGLDERIEWTRLEILDRVSGGTKDDEGTVTFIAHYRLGGIAGSYREHSRFCREGGEWVYMGDNVVSGRVGKIGRNYPCPCGSGRKFKKCCGS